MEFEIINITNINNSFTVEVEILKTRERRRFGYPLYEGWENEYNGEIRFIRDIREKLKKEEENSNTDSVMKYLKKNIGKKIKVE